MRTALAFLVALTLFAISSPASAANYTKTSKVIGNNVAITSSGGTTTVTASNSCNPGVSGYLYQSILVLFGGSSYAVTQSNTCP